MTTSIDDGVVHLDPPAHWPLAPREPAYHGVAGELARLVEPYTEADPVAILSQFLIAFGNVVGRGPHRMVGATPHYTNEFMVIVGNSSKGRKGTSWDFVEMMIRDLDPKWLEERQGSGLSTGEGLVTEIRDSVEVTDKKGELVTQDAGEPDKRLLVVEGEFAQILKVMTREGNTLSPIIRNAWDSKNLRIMNKTSPMKATDPHISIIGHITTDEFLRCVNATELANGFINRYMLFMVRRTKMLPDGGDVSQIDFGPLKERVQLAFDWARKTGEMQLSDDAKQHWREMYQVLSQEKPGLYGSAVARAEAHVVRLSMLYALLDCSPSIELVHLQAGLALWGYADRSAHHIFGDTLGDPVADEIWNAMCDAGGVALTRDEVRNLFSRNKSTKVLNHGLQVLERAGRLQKTMRAPAGGKGRPAQVFIPNLPDRARRSDSAVSPV